MSSCHCLIPQAFVEICLLLCRELHKATSNFTALLGQGAFGPVYKAVLPSTVTTLAVKVLAEQSKQGDREFQNEVFYASSLP
jgi:hypothetical protein